MKSKLWKIGLCAVIAALTLCLAGCGESENQSSTDESQASQEIDGATKVVIDRIDNLGTVTEDSGKAISWARQAYDALTDEKKQLVNNYSILEDAEAAYSKLVPSDSTSLGSDSPSASSSSSSSDSHSNSSSSSSSKKETDSYYNPKDGSSLYEYSDGSKEITDGYGNVGRDKDGDGKLDEISTDGGKTWKKN